MVVHPSVREAERQIDAAIQELPLWRHSRETVLGCLLTHYRDCFAALSLASAHAQLLGSEGPQASDFALERDLNAGMLWSLKWAMTYATEVGHTTDLEPEELTNVLFKTAPAYEILVDVLKLADRDEVTIEADIAGRTLTVDQGGDRTGYDLSILAQQWSTNPVYDHVSLTDDDDQLTKRWRARDFRRATKWLNEQVTKSDLGMVVTDITDPPIELFENPAIITIPEVFADQAVKWVIDDLTMDESRLKGEGFWKLASWLDMPIVQVGRERRGASNVIRALATQAGDSHMLRIAARVDPDQYSRASVLREGRMVVRCRDVLEGHGWKVAEHVRDPGPPPREIDVVATRGGDTMLLQLKSVLRPESAWEVIKRNKEVLAGIDHTTEILGRFPHPIGLVMTDGYRGDFSTWHKALRANVPIVTLHELDLLAANPSEAIEQIKVNRGIGVPPPDWAAAPDGEVELVGWTIRLTGAA